MTRIAAVIYSSDNLDWTSLSAMYLRHASDPLLTEIVVIDNGSTIPFPELGDRNFRYGWNIGGNAVFHRWMQDDWFEGEPPEFLAFFHCDLFIHESWWDHRVIEAFEADPKLSLIGFAGSDEIDNLGGRGKGTMLNYTGAFFEGIGTGSAAEHHGRRERGLKAAAVIDHCAMIFRRSALETLTPQEGNYAPEHFYDRLMSCEVIERGEHVAVLGIGCDHFSGGIRDGMQHADGLRRKWLEAEGVPFDPEDTYNAVYKESERRFFDRFGDLFPFYVTDDYQVIRR